MPAVEPSGQQCLAWRCQKPGRDRLNRHARGIQRRGAGSTSRSTVFCRGCAVPVSVLRPAVLHRSGMLRRAMHLSISALRRQVLSLVVFRALALGAGLPMPVSAQPVASAPPSFAELEAVQARIGEVRVRTEDVFDTQNPKEASALYRWANALHIQTRASVIENALLFKRGDPVSVAVIDETERLLRGERYLYDVQIRPVAYQDGVVDIEVVTRDSWSLIPGVSAARAGGENSTGIRLREYNFLGTGTTLGIGHSSDVDRSSNQLLLSNDRVFGSLDRSDPEPGQQQRR